MSKPIKPALDVLGSRKSVNLEMTKLICGKCSGVRLLMMFGTECNHAIDLVMLLLVPKWIKVVPLKIGVSATGYRTPKTNLFPEMLTYLFGRCAIHERVSGLTPEIYEGRVNGRDVAFFCTFSFTGTLIVNGRDVAFFCTFSFTGTLMGSALD